MPPPSASEVLSYMDSLSNWGRWGPDDCLGTLNFIDSQRRRAAYALAVDGVAVSCGLEISVEPKPGDLFGSPQRYMLATGEGFSDSARVLPPPYTETTDRSGGSAGQSWQRSSDVRPRFAGAREFIGLVFHGVNVTHVDALSHTFWDGRMYNNQASSLVTSHSGATRMAVTDVPEGILGRGVLLDVAASRGVRWLEPGDGVHPADLDRAAEMADVTVGPGDIVLLRTGYGRRRRDEGPMRVDAGQAGWHAACLPWLYERDVAAIGCDTAQDVIPTGYEGTDLGLPVHTIGIVAMGLWLIDNCDLEELSSTCQRLARHEFLLSISTLRIAGATGSPVNPIAMF